MGIKLHCQHLYVASTYGKHLFMTASMAVCRKSVGLSSKPQERSPLMEIRIDLHAQTAHIHYSHRKFFFFKVPFLK